MRDTITGSTIADRYRITGLLRAGRMGDIYVARRISDGARVCVKLLDPALFDNDEAVKRFERESKVTRRLDHPCSMRVLDFGRSTHGPYLVMEFVEGETLSDVLAETPLQADRAVRVAGLIAMALQAAHDIGIVHRDLAPTNVLVTTQNGMDVVKVTDFGLSMLTEASDDRSESNLTAVGVRIGTPTYMAPEYIEEYELDHRADLYGLGVMLFEMLVGKAPFIGRPYKVMDAHVNAPVPRPSQHTSEPLPEWIDELVGALMAKRPDDRPATAAEVVEAIERGLGATLTVVDYVSESVPPAPVRSMAPPSEAPTADPILTRFIEHHMGQVSRSKAAAPDRSRCYRVAEVAPVSIAAELGISAGWLVQIVGEEGLLDVELYKRMADSRAYHFHPPGGGERVTLVTGGIPIGVRLTRTVENIVAHYDPLNPDPWALFELWEQREFKHLEQLSWRTITQQRGATSLLSTGLFARFLGTDTPKLHDHPALMFHGAATIELDITNAQSGMAEIIDYKVKYAARWPNAYDAVAHFYAAKDKLRAGNKELALDLLRQSFALHPTAAVAELHDDITGEAMEVSSWLGQVFTDYSMDAIDSKLSARLSAVCQGMDESELLVICMMGGFRGNPDYDAFMRRYTTIAAYFSDFFVGLHVVTTATKRDKEHPDHYVGEDLARHAGVGFLVLHDYRAFVQRAVKPRKQPTIYVINKHGQCVHEGSFGVVDVWNALDRAGQIRVHNLRS